MYFGFSPELNAVIDAGVAKYGQLELAKRFLFHYMRENGVTYGDAWQCLMELPESCFEDSAYFFIKSSRFMRSMRKSSTKIRQIL